MSVQDLPDRIRATLAAYDAEVGNPELERPPGVDKMAALLRETLAILDEPHSDLPEVTWTKPDGSTNTYACVLISSSPPKFKTEETPTHE